MVKPVGRAGWWNSGAIVPTAARRKRHDCVQGRVLAHVDAAALLMIFSVYMTLVEMVESKRCDRLWLTGPAWRCETCQKW
jgi:hypothetical protein